MSIDTLFETERLILRTWRDEDLDPFADMCADPEVMRHFPDIMTRAQSEQLIEKARFKTVEWGFCISPIEIRDTGEFLGFVGLNVPNYDRPLPFDPCVEIGWRLKQSAWGKGYASEAARVWLRFGFETIGLNEIVAFTTPGNLPSQMVMERIGMNRDSNGDFLHPTLESDHPMALHVLYRLDKAGWFRAQP